MQGLYMLKVEGFCLKRTVVKISAAYLGEVGLNYPVIKLWSSRRIWTRPENETNLHEVA